MTKLCHFSLILYLDSEINDNLSAINTKLNGLKCYTYNTTSALPTDDFINAVKAYIDANVGNTGLFILGGLNLNTSYYTVTGYKVGNPYYHFTFACSGLAYNCYVADGVLTKTAM